MTYDATDIAIRPQKGIWILIFVPFMVAAFVAEMVRLEINPFWWIPPLLLVAFFMFERILGQFEIIFRSSTRTVEVRYRIGRRPKIYSFDDLDFIQSYIWVSGEAETYVQLALRLKNGNQLPLLSEHAAWDSSAHLFGLSGAREPQDLAILRQKISSLIGIRDLGFC